MEVKTRGIGVAGLLGVAFVVLKLCRVVDWSWWWVTVPFWGPLVLAALVVAVWFVVYMACGMFGRR